MASLRVLLVYPEVPQTFWSLTHALKFFGKRAWSPPLGLLTVAAMLPAHFELRFRDLNVGALGETDLDWADYVFISAMDIQRDAARRLIDRCRRAGVKVVAGGPLFTSDPGSFRDVDHLVLHEAEVTLPRFLKDLANGSAQPLYASSEFADMSTSPPPAYALLDPRPYGALSVQFSRGCPYECEFCDVTTLFGRRPRIKTAAQIITELDRLYRLGWRGKIYFVDDNLMADRPYLKKQLLPALVAWRRGKRGLSFHTQITLNLADDQQLIDLMYEAGFDWVFIGIETPDEASLAECKKKQNLHRNLPDQIRLLQRSGLQVQGGFIIGFDHDPPDIFRRQFDLIQQNGIVMAMVGLLQALRGTELHRRLQREGRLLGDCSGDNVIDDTNILTRMDRETLRENYRILVRALYEPGSYYQRVRNFLAEYKEPLDRPPLGSEAVLALARGLFWLGLVHAGRMDFWRTLVWTGLKKPGSLQNFLGLAILGYHFRKVITDALGQTAAPRPAGGGAVTLAELHPPTPALIREPTRRSAGPVGRTIPGAEAAR